MLLIPKILSPSPYIFYSEFKLHVFVCGGWLFFLQGKQKNLLYSGVWNQKSFVAPGIEVYSKSILAEQTTPAFFALNDSIASASGSVSKNAGWVVCLFGLGPALVNVGKLGGGFKYCLFSPLLGEMIQFDEHIFQMGWFNHQLVNNGKLHKPIAWIPHGFFMEKNTMAGGQPFSTAATEKGVAFFDLDLDEGDIGGAL